MFNIKKRFAFTIIELLVTLGILAILSTMTIPIYQKYTLRGKVAGMLAAATEAKLVVAHDYFNNNNSLAAIDYTAGSQNFLDPQGDYIASIAITNGVITVTGNTDELYGNSIVLTFTPTVVNNQFVWTCSTSSGFYEYAPDQCHN